MSPDELTREELRTVVRTAVRAELLATTRKLVATAVGAIAAWWGLLLATSGTGGGGVRGLAPVGLGVVLFVLAVALVVGTWDLWPLGRAAAE